MYRIETGRRRPSRETLARLARALDMDPDALIGQVKALEDSAGGPVSDRGGGLGVLAESSAGKRGGDASVGDVTWCQEKTVRCLTGVASLPVSTIENVVASLEHIFRFVIKIWDGSEAKPHRCSRGVEHHLRMTDALGRLFAPEIRRLKVDEIRLLLAGVWLHDLGIALVKDRIDQGEQETVNAAIRYLREHFYELGLSDSENTVLENVCRYYSDLQSLNGVTIDADSFIGAERQKSLIALVRLANITAVRQERVTPTGILFGSIHEPEYEVAFGELMINLFVESIHRDRGQLIVRVVYGRDWQQSRIRSLMSLIQSELQESLNRVSDVLMAALRCPLSRVRVLAGSEPKAEVSARLKYALDRLGTARSPNAARVMKGTIETLEGLLDDEGVAAVPAYLLTELDRFIALHPTHAKLHNLRDELQLLFVSHADHKERMDSIGRLLARYSEEQSDAQAKIGTAARSIFPAKGSYLLFIFGYSACVLEALKALEVEYKRRANVVVVECRNKTVYSRNNCLQYSDASEYASEIETREFASVRIASDATVASILTEELGVASSGLASAMVLLGCNGIDPDSGFYSTAGALSISIVARNYGVPIYALAESAKLRDEMPLPAELVRDNNLWYTRDGLTLKKLDESGVRIYSPSDDFVPMEFVDRFITEKGVLDPGELRSAFEHTLEMRRLFRAKLSGRAPDEVEDFWLAEELKGRPKQLG